MTGASTFQKVISKDVYGTKVTKYVSKETGLAVVLADVNSPLVNGYFVLSTEAFDDKGLPHTLEHFVFLGSEEYPYKGVLDTLSNRCLAQGTNAWTDTDHTCYTISTAGEEGFLIILPVYLDHILHPTLTESAFYTEIHHVNGLGEDSGVVYCEMQGRENTAESIIFLQIQRTMYPEPCGYRHETGGIMADLRTLTSDEVRAYHRDNYRPDNLTIVVTGQVDETRLLKALEPIENKLLQRGIQRMQKRPWIDSPRPAEFASTIVKVERFPDEQEVNGMVQICWRTREYCDFITEHALDVVHDYLTDSAVSLLQQTFVEITDPYCSSVDFSTVDNLASLQILSFSSVPVARLDFIEPLFFSTLKAELDVKGIDMDRIKLVLKKAKQNVLDSLETDPHNYFSHLIIGAAIYGDKEGHTMMQSLHELSFLEQLEAWTKQEWTDFVRKYFIERPYFCQIGKPSTEFASELQDTEKKRTEEQCKRLGENELKNLAGKLEEMAELNDTPIPESLLESFPVPKYQNVPLPQIQTAFSLSKAKDNELQQRVVGHGTLPRIQFDDFVSGFVSIQMFADTSKLELEQRLFLDVFLAGFFEVPVFDRFTGHELSHEQVVRGILEDNVETQAGFGDDGEAGTFQCGNFAQLAVIEIKAVRENYAKAIRWLELLAHCQHWTVDRIRITANKALNNLPTVQRDGYRMLDATVRQALYSDSSNLKANSVISQSEVLPKLLSLLSENPDYVLGQFKRISHVLFGSNASVLFHVKGDLVKVPDLTSAWGQWTEPAGPSTSIFQDIPLSQHHLSCLAQNIGTEHALLSMPSIESTFAYHVVKGPRNFNDPDLPGLLVVNEMLHTMEGHFWKEIRGNGLAYGASLHLHVESGFLSLSIYRSTDASKAFEAARNIVMQLLESSSRSSSVSSSASSANCADDSDGSSLPERHELDEIEFEAAKSSVAFAIISQEETASRAASTSFITQTLKGLPSTANRDLLVALEKLSLEDCMRILEQYVAPLFQSETSFAAVVSNPGKLEDVRRGYKELGFNLNLCEKAF